MIKEIYFAIFCFTLLLSCSNEEKLTKDEEEKYLYEGAEIVVESYNTLKDHLIAKMEKESIAEAIKYCNLKALPLLDSLSKEYNAEIRRTSLKIRNPKNRPLDYEEDVLEEYAEKHKNGEKLPPLMKKFKNGTIVFYVPIIIENPICLNCHGPRKIMITEPNDKIIDSLYPTDEAINYNIGDFRGMWSVRFKLDKPK